MFEGKPIDKWYYNMIMVSKDGEWKDRQQPFIMDQKVVADQEK